MAELDRTIIDDSGFINLPVGTTAQRPNSPEIGMMRWNTDEEYVEFYNGAEWIAVESGGGGLYEFTSATFTPGGSTGRTGPSLSQARNGLSGTGTNNWKNNTEFFDVSNGIQLWTVPQNGTYRIEAWGAQGGGSGGRGARMRGDFNLSEGEKIKILVGHKGFPTSGRGSSGGGGTFVVKNVNVPSNSDILVISGGGAGSRNQSNTPFSWMHGQTGTSGEDAQNAGGSGGTNGNGGGSGSEGAGGGGMFSDGADSGSRGGGEAFINGGLGGVDGGSYDEGGFGSGGAAYDSTGGGGGYSGGGGAEWSGPSGPNGGPYHFGGGGGSFNSGSNQSNSGNANSGDGQVEITLL